MKKLFILLIAACVLTSCYVESTNDSNCNLPHSKIIDIQVNQNEWKYSGQGTIKDNNYFYATFSIPEITPTLYNDGVVQVYREYYTGSRTAVQKPLPQVALKEYFDSNVNLWGYYTETVDYEYAVGLVNIIYKASDFAYEEDPTLIPETMHFRVVLMW